METRGLRALPLALGLSFAITIVMSFVRLSYVWTTAEPWSSVRFNLLVEGTSFASLVLAVLGTFELARRVTGREALGAMIAAVGFAAVLALDVSYVSTSFIDDAWKHEWLAKTYEYAFYVAWLVVPVGLAVACWQTKRELAIFIIVVSLLTYPAPFLAKVMYGWLPQGKAGWAIDVLFRIVRTGAMFAVFAAVARGSGSGDIRVAASGLRSAGRALWLRVVAAVVVVVLTLMIVAGRDRSGVEFLRLAMMTGAIINIVALAQFALGAARAARVEVADLAVWPLVAGATASLWATGVALAQLPYLYRILYERGDRGFMGERAQGMAQALSIATPLVVTAGVTLVGLAISGFAAKRGNDDLRGHAQSKITGFVALTLVGLAIQQWMIPKATQHGSVGTFVILSLLAAGSALVGTVMMAKLLDRAAAALEGEPALPKASVIASRTP